MTRIDVSPASAEARDFVLQGFAETLTYHQARFPGYFNEKRSNQIVDGVTRAVDAAVSGEETPLTVLAARSSGQLAGYVMLKPVVNSGGIIDDIYSAPTARRQGVGVALLQAVAAHARQARWPTVVACVWDGNAPSHGLFQSAGYAAIKQGIASRLLRQVDESKRMTHYLLQV